MFHYIQHASQLHIKKQCMTQDTIETILELNIEDGEYVYKDFINFSTDHPDVKITEMLIEPESENQYVASFHATKPVYKKDLTITLKVEKPVEQSISDAHIHMTYMTSLSKKIEEFIIPLSFETKIVKKEEAPEV